MMPQPHNIDVELMCLFVVICKYSDVSCTSVPTIEVLYSASQSHAHVWRRAVKKLGTLVITI